MLEKLLVSGIASEMSNKGRIIYSLEYVFFFSKIFRCNLFP